MPDAPAADHVQVDTKARTTHASEMLQWYWRDFGNTKEQACERWVAGIGVRGGEVSEAQRCFDPAFKIKWEPYSWKSKLSVINNIEG